MNTTAKLMLAILLLLLGAIAGALAAEYWLFSPRLSAASDEIRGLERGNSDKAAKLTAANAALLAQKRALELLKSSAASEQAKMQAALGTAREAAKKHYSAANVVLASAPSGQNACEAARIAFDLELKQERE